MTASDVPRQPEADRKTLGVEPVLQLFDRPVEVGDGPFNDRKTCGHRRVHSVVYPLINLVTQRAVERVNERLGKLLEAVAQVLGFGSGVLGAARVTCLVRFVDSLSSLMVEA